MLTINTNLRPEETDLMQPIKTFPLAFEVQIDSETEQILAELSPEVSWGERQQAAKRIGYTKDPAALPGLLAALPGDPFWMVRCAIIQAVEMIGDPQAVPALQEVVEFDNYQVVRSYAAKAVERLS
jgi:HEAT repeat protein